jgi:hypothetical protein
MAAKQKAKLDKAKAQEAFAGLRKILVKHSAGFRVKFDTPSQYGIESREALWNRKPLFFAAVQIKKSYVSFHLLPLYACPDLKKDLSAELTKRIHGTACLNFKEPDARLFAELNKLTKAALAVWNSGEFLRRLADRSSRFKS